LAHNRTSSTVGCQEVRRRLQKHEYYLAYQPPKDYVERKRIVQELIALGAVRIHYSLWRVQVKQAKPILHLVRGRHAIVFRRSRGISVPSMSPGKGELDIGTVVLIAYRLPKWSSRKRAALSRALSGVPAMKVGRCLYMVPQLKASKAPVYQRLILTSTELARFLDDRDFKVEQLSNLRVVYPVNQEPLLRAYIEAQTEKIERLNRACRRLRQPTLDNVPVDAAGLRKLLSSYRLRYRSLRDIVLYLRKEMGVDLRPALKRAYVALMSCRVLLESPAQ